MTVQQTVLENEIRRFESQDWPQVGPVGTQEHDTGNVMDRSPFYWRNDPVLAAEKMIAVEKVSWWQMKRRKCVRKRAGSGEQVGALAEIVPVLYDNA